MKRNWIFLALALAISTFLACSNNASKEEASSEKSAESKMIEEKLWDEVMVAHDEVMPKMSDIHRISKSLSDKVEGADEATQANIQSQVEALETAAEGMMSWMAEIRQLEPLRDSLSHEEIVNYLNNEKQKVGKVKEEMLSSIKAGEDLLSTIE